MIGLSSNFTKLITVLAGLTDREEGHFVWIDGSPMSYTDWSISEYETPDRYIILIIILMCDFMELLCQRIG